MINPQMMGQMGGQLPTLPSVKELWKKEKSKYRHWIILFGVGLLVIFGILLAASIMNWANPGEINSNDITFTKLPSGNYTVNIVGGSSTKYYIAKAIFDNATVNSQNVQGVIDEVNKSYVISYIVLPTIKIAFLVIGIVLYADSLFKSYKAQSFAKISTWPTMVVGIAALLAFFSFFSLGSKLSFSDQFKFAGGIFAFVANLLFIIIYFAASAPVSRLRRIFLLSERLEEIKKTQQSPEFQNMQQQFMQGQGSMGTFGTMAGMKPTPNAQTGNTVTPVQPPIDPERKKLMDMSKVELVDVAKELSISGYSTMTKDELVEAIIRITKQHDK